MHAPVHESPSVHALLVRSARGMARLLVLMFPGLCAVNVLNGEAAPAPSLVYFLVLETLFVALWLLARGRGGERWPEQILFGTTLTAVAGVIFSPSHLLFGFKPYAMLAPMVASTFASLAPVRPWLTWALALSTAALYWLSLELVPADRFVDPVSYAVMCLAMAALGASFARDQLRLWAELEHNRARALEATRLKSEFLTNMSHEIRTPMTAILGFAEEVELELGVGPRNAKIRAALQTVRRNGAHLLALINGILDLSKIEAGRLEVARERCSPLQLVAEVRSLLGVQAVEKGLALEAVAVGSVPEEIETDRTRLRQILINLVGNAVKFTERGSVRIELGLETRPGDPAPWLELAVVDTGPGIAPEGLSRVFEAFTQLQGSLTREHEGTGLGLALSRRLARSLGGDVLVSSALGRGSRFSVRIPAPPLAGVAVLAPDQVGNFAVLERAPLAHTSIALSGRVLLVEDGADNQRLIAGILRRAGAAVEIAANGLLGCELALRAAANGEPFDVVLMDMQMPVLDGYTAVRRLRDAGYDGAIIALTAQSMAGDRERCLALGCSDYATKPIAREQLLAQVATQLCKAHSA